MDCFATRRRLVEPSRSRLAFLLLVSGVWRPCLKSVTAGALGLAVVATLALIATARAEEAENLARFGGDYADHMKRTRRFVPFLG
jgi:protein-S-isoprenylcysteine O-methyltransferase Ste14